MGEGGGEEIWCLVKQVVYTKPSALNAHSLGCVLASELKMKGFLFPLEIPRAIHSPYHMFAIRNCSSKLNKNYCAA